MENLYITKIKWGLIIWTPTAQIHDSPKRLLRFLQFLISELVRQSTWDFLGLWIWSEIGLCMLLDWPHSWIPSTNTLVLQSLYNSNTCCHNPSPSCCCWTHFCFLFGFFLKVNMERDFGGESYQLTGKRSTLRYLVVLNWVNKLYVCPYIDRVR